MYAYNYTVVNLQDILSKVQEWRPKATKCVAFSLAILFRMELILLICDFH